MIRLLKDYDDPEIILDVYDPASVCVSSGDEKKAYRPTRTLDLKGALSEWQNALRLNDWDITAEEMSPAEMQYRYPEDAKDSDAINVINTHHNKSRIIINSEAPGKELSLIHELVHLFVNGLDRVMDRTIKVIPDGQAKEYIQMDFYNELEKSVCAIARAFENVRDMAHG